MSNTKDFYYDTYGRVQRRSPPTGDPHAGSSLTAQVSGTYGAHYQHSRPSQTPYEASNYNAQYGNTYSAAPVQQHPQQAGYPGYQQVHETRYGTPYYSSRSTPPATNAQPRRLPPLSVPPQQAGRDERWQAGAPYYPPSQVDAQMMSASDVRSPHATYPHATYPQQYQTMPVGYSGTPAPQRGVVSTNVPVMGNQYPQHPTMMGHASVERSMPVRGSAQLPYARAAPIMSPVDYEPSGDPNEPMIKKKRKRADARQLEALNNTFQRTAFPSTEERAALAKELDMSARSVQIWFQNKRQSMKQGSRQAGAPSGNTSSISQTVPAVPVPAPSPSASGYRGSPSVLSPTTTTGPSGSSYSSRSPPPGYGIRAGTSPSPPMMDPRARQMYGGRY
ncbi:homeobox-domain-containing protein [Auriscalpium vulgare]|uniref:Homeobox-domain-containing protein n=1 Tax=Auriscalpium vulgare TaxID=40419 RepID=A0ACB8S425_9AGAM|nr:homeobox-domain-containing protein [Auriscalpium vulgare]